MKRIIKFTVIIILFFLTISIPYESRTQVNLPQDYFKSPLKIKLILSGSFGELRGNHFHSGIDIKTQGVVGKAVLATADGYISRIKVSPWGYGNALYITHPNGYTSVYAHLSKYNDTIAQIVKQKQYKGRTFALEIFPEKGSIKVKQGDIIAFSGNSGSSGGPHLHFEIRNSKQQPINPFLFGIKVKDHKFPRIRKLRIYNYLSESPIYNYQEYNLQQTKGNIKVQNKDTISISTELFYPAVEGFDQLDGANNHNGYYKLIFIFDGKKFFEFTADKISFSQKRQLNSYIDYREYKTGKHNNRFQRTLIEENTNLMNTKTYGNKQGLIQLIDTKSHKIEIIAIDFAGQKSELSFYVKRKGGLKYKELNIKEYSIFEWNHVNTFRKNDFEITIPKGAFFSRQYFRAITKENPYNKYSKLCHIYDIGVPLNKYCNIKIKLNDSIIIKDKNKLCILSLNTKNQRIYEGGSYSKGYLSTKTRSFGRYYIDIDTIPPTIKTKNIYNNKNITSQKRISFTVTDNLSGIKYYKATIDGVWVLLEYDPKKNHMYYTIDNHFKAGKHKFKILLKDNKGNTSTKNFTLLRN